MNDRRLIRNSGAVFFLAAAVLVLSSLPARAQNKEMDFSLGEAAGDYHKSFVVGLTGGLRLFPFVHGEVELFYYRMPGPRSAEPGLAKTSTALDLDFSAVLQPDKPLGGFLPYAVVTAGRLYESETWKYSAIHVVTHHSYTRWNAGLGAGTKIVLSKTSGLRLEFRWIRILEKDKQVPRYTAGYILYL